MILKVLDLGFRGLGFWGYVFLVLGLGFRLTWMGQGSIATPWNVKCDVWGLGCRV